MGQLPCSPAAKVRGQGAVSCSALLPLHTLSANAPSKPASTRPPQRRRESAAKDLAHEVGPSCHGCRCVSKRRAGGLTHPPRGPAGPPEGQLGLSEGRPPLGGRGALLRLISVQQGACSLSAPQGRLLGAAGAALAAPTPAAQLVVLQACPTRFGGLPLPSSAPPAPMPHLRLGQATPAGRAKSCSTATCSPRRWPAPRPPPT